MLSPQTANEVASDTVDKLKDIWSGVAGDLHENVQDILPQVESTVALVLLENDPEIRAALLDEIDDAMSTLLEAQEEHLQQGAKESLIAVTSGTFKLVVSVIGAVLSVLLLFPSCKFTTAQATEAGRIDVADIAPSVHHMAQRLQAKLGTQPVLFEIADFMIEMDSWTGSRPVTDFEPPMLYWCDLHDEVVDSDLTISPAQKATYKLTTASIRTVIYAALGDSGG